MLGLLSARTNHSLCATALFQANVPEQVDVYIQRHVYDGDCISFILRLLLKKASDHFGIAFIDKIKRVCYTSMHLYVIGSQ